MTLGQRLANARKDAGLTLEDLSNRTNIRATLLKEFEENRFNNAGGDTYARGHLRNIAKAFGIDQDSFLLDFDEEHAQVARAIHEQLVENNAMLPIPEKSKITQKQLIAFSAIGIVAILGISLTINSLKQSAESPKVVASASPTPSSSPSENLSPSATPSTNSYSSGTGVSVQLEATAGSSWLFVSDAAGVTLYSGRATQGQIFQFSSTESVNLRIGNAGAVKLTVNGKEVPPLGGNGEVVNVSYGVNS